MRVHDGYKGGSMTFVGLLNWIVTFAVRALCRRLLHHHRREAGS